MSRRHTTPLRRASLVLTMLCALGASAAQGGERPDPEASFERLKALAGTWEGSTSRGDAVRVTYELIAGGTTVLERFLPNDGELVAMATAYHLDGDRLLLTHYCMGGNQPRMEATQAEGDSLRFDLVDATGLDREGEGHMAGAVFQFEGADRLRSAWTWRQDGKDQFTETTTLRRVQPDHAADGREGT